MAMNDYGLQFFSINELKLLPKMVKVLKQYVVPCFLLYLLLIFLLGYNMLSVMFLLMML